MLKLLAIMTGGGIGAAGRHGLFLLVQGLTGPTFPAGTLLVNLTGSFMIGILWNLFERMHFSHEMRLFVFTGFLGGFTTFSTFTRETCQLIKVGDWKTALLYILLSNILGICLVAGGFLLGRRLWPITE